MTNSIKVIYTIMKNMILCLVVITLSISNTNASEAKIEQLLQSVVRGAEFNSDYQLEASNSQYHVSVIGFQLKQATNNYGSVIAVVDSKSKNLVWAYTVFGDFGPHTVRLIDFDGDNRDDLWILSGFEDVFSTKLFLNRAESEHFSLTNFVSGYLSDEVYATLLDFNSDGFPEIMFPKNYKPIEINSFDDIQKANCFNFSDEVNQLAKVEYLRVAGEFEKFNFTYNFETYHVHSLFLKNQIEILSKYPKNIFVTNEYTDHLNWRKKMIAKIIDQSDTMCRTILTEHFQ